LDIIKNQNRISIIDGFRAIAIISVVLYHYFYRWNDSVYPYFAGNYFHYGFKGVPFFFMISGFVICYTLENTLNFASFWKKRFIRLFPSMFIASILTFGFLLLFDYNNIFEDNYFRNLLTSLTFLPPNLFNWLFNSKNHFGYLNHDYWSLWTEIQFYFISSVIYFLNKLNFRRNFIIFCFIIFIANEALIFSNCIKIGILEKITNLFNLTNYIAFFLSGALFYFIYSDRKFVKTYIGLLMILFFILNYSLNSEILVSSTIMFVLFFGFIYYPKFLKFLESKFIIKIGISSYFLYLIHGYIGAVCIKNYVAFFYPYSFVAPSLVLILMIFFSIFYTKHIEPAISTRLKKYLF